MVRQTLFVSSVLPSAAVALRNLKAWLRVFVTLQTTAGKQKKKRIVEEEKKKRIAKWCSAAI